MTGAGTDILDLSECSVAYKVQVDIPVIT